LRRRGRKRPAEAEFLLKQVAEVFTSKKKVPGARLAAKELGICLASFYKYADGINIPDMDVLRAAKEKWGIKWTYLDPSEIIRVTKTKSPEQLVLSFLNSIREDDIEIVEVTPEGKSILQISLKIRFPAWTSSK
jgi:hypothetical protein